MTALLRPLSVCKYWVLLFMLTGCVGNQTRLLPAFDDWETRKFVLEQTDEWEFAGRIGVSAGEEGFNGKLWWRQDGVVFRARISGPLGIGTIFINGNRRELTLTDRDGVVTRLTDAERELRERFGWTIPVSSLRFWALGIPDPASPALEKLGENALLEELTQEQWQVSIGQYAEGGGQPMPRRLVALSGDVKVRLVIDSWTFR